MKLLSKILVAPSMALLLTSNLYSQDLYSTDTISLGEAIKEISKISKIPYIVDKNILKDKKANLIKDVKSLDEALNQVLKGTGLKAVISNNTIVITKEISSESQNKLEDIEVYATSTRTNISVDKGASSIKIISQEEILEQLSISTNSSDVLSNLISSFSPSRQKLSGSGETLRGRVPLLLIDGVPQSNPLRVTGRESHTIDFKMVDRIEIINGATSTHGISGLGGIINIITKEASEDKVSQTFDIQTTMSTSDISSETASYKVSYSIGGKEEKLDYFVSASYEDQGLYLDGNGDAVGANNIQGDLMDSKSYDFLSKLTYHIDDSQNIKFLVNKYNYKNNNNYISVEGDKENNILTTATKGTPEGKAPFNDTLTTRLSYENKNFYDMALNAMVFNQRFEGLFGATDSANFQDASIATVGTLYDQTRVKSTKYGSKFTLNKNGLLDNRLKLTFGFDTLFDETFQDLYLTNRTYVPKSRYNVISPFIFASYDITDNLTFHSGVRYEKGQMEVDSYTTVAARNSVFVEGGDIDIDEVLYNAGFVYDFKNDVNIFANYSEGFTLADIGRALRSINTTGVSLSSFSDLDPIITDNYEIGIRAKRGIFDFEASLFQSESDFGSRIELDGAGTYLLKREKTRIRGFDLGLGVNVNDDNKLNFLYSYSKGKYDSDKNGSLDTTLSGLNIAPNRLISKWSSKIDDNLSAFLQVNHAFDRSFDDKSSNFSGYTLVDLAGSYKLSNGTLSLSFANLFDKQYVTYYSQSASSSDLNYTSGRGRTFTLGYSLKF